MAEEIVIITFVKVLNFGQAFDDIECRNGQVATQTNLAAHGSFVESARRFGAAFTSSPLHLTTRTRPLDARGFLHTHTRVWLKEKFLFCFREKFRFAKKQVQIMRDCGWKNTITRQK